MGVTDGGKRLKIGVTGSSVLVRSEIIYTRYTVGADVEGKAGLAEAAEKTAAKRWTFGPMNEGHRRD